jgi:hypothetical protein
MVLDDVDVCVQVKHLLEGGNEALLVKEVGALADCRQGGAHRANCMAATREGWRGQGKPSAKSCSAAGGTQHFSA